MNFISAQISKTGGRQVNQDFCGKKITETGGVWIVADGLGGHRGGEVASEAAVTAILDEWNSSLAHTPQMLTSLVDAAQAAIIVRQEASPQLSSMRTTLVLLAAKMDAVLWAHVGDSRLYHFRDCGVAFQTKDHSVPQMLVDAGEITKDEIRSHPDRNRILRAVGNPEGVKPKFHDEPCRVRPGDAFLLCTDGFWEYVTETEMSADLAKSGAPEDWLALMELRLLERATGEHDNYSALAVFVEE